MTRPSGLVVAALIAIALGAPPVAARQESVGREELRDLAVRAIDEDAALHALRGVDEVDGRPVDITRALEGAEGDELRRRLELLVQEVEVTRIDREAVRAETYSILAQERFRPPDVPRPLRGLLRRLGALLRPVGEPFADLFDRVAARLPGGSATLWALLAAVFLTLVALFSLRLAHRGMGAAVERFETEARVRPLDPRRLEREADECERRGDLEKALRLRFRAGLLRLDRADVIRFRESITSSEIARLLHSRSFEKVAAVFDQVVYGGRAPDERDVEESRTSWSRVLEEVAAR